MNKYSKLLKKFLLTTPVISISVLFNTPAEAATFAFSKGNLLFSEFSQSPSNVATDTDTLTIEEGSGRAIATSEAEFIVKPARAANSSLSAALSRNSSFLGIAESEASVIGNFDIKADTNFSFDFSSNLELATSIDNPPQENATASGSIFFELIDIENGDTLEFFNLTGNITTDGDNDFVAFQKSDNLILSETFSAPGFGDLQEFLTVSVEGSFENYFANATNLALVEVKQNRVKVVKTPESSNKLALLLASGVIGVIVHRKRK